MTLRSVLTFTSVIFIAQLSASAFAEDAPDPSFICARNFIPNPQNLDPCATSPNLFKRLKGALDSNLILCTKVYDEKYCKDAPKEFRHAMSADGKPVCTVHYHQERIAEYCFSNPETFQWAVGAE
ncbi:MAG: hypothetical protein NT027_06030 [Proteobacteria bacterium]|nr:hypothetical protein [Pseudomonadota bacterium]